MLDVMNQDERRAWEYVAIAASMVLKLEEQHPMEREEACHAFHQIQNYLMARPGIRKVKAALGHAQDCDVVVLSGEGNVFDTLCTCGGVAVD